MTADFLSVGTEPSKYKQLKDMDLLRWELSQGEPDASAEDWFEFNQAMEEAAPPVEHTAEQEDMLASGLPALVNLTDVVEEYMTIDGHPFSFKNREFTKGIYDYFEEYPDGCRNTLLIASRQVGKSSAQAAKAAGLGIAFNAFKTLYVAPRYNQVTLFSKQRFQPMCFDSEVMMRDFVDPNRNTWEVLAKQFNNGSFFNFRACYRDADGARGISANHLLIDEIQDIPPDAIPVLEQCQSSFVNDLRYRLYAGTPKSTANIISLHWNDTCQFEWMTKCTHCGHWSLSDESIVGDHFFQCSSCKKEIYPKIHGQWVARNTAKLNKRWGFHISQVTSPAIEHKNIVADRDNPNIPRSKYLNETLGLPYDEGDAGIADADLERACKPEPMLTPQQITEQYAKRGYKIYAGIDYGTGEGANPSLTVLTIGTMQRNGIFKVLFMKKFYGREAETTECFNIVNRICDQASVDWLGADWGHGAHQNARMERERGWNRVGRTRVIMEFKYVTQQKELNWTGKYYHVDRNQTMDRCIDGIRNCDVDGGIIFFNYEQFNEFRMDLTTITIEYNERTGSRRYVHQLPDDAFHSINYAYMAARQGSGLGVPVSFYS